MSEIPKWQQAHEDRKAGMKYGDIATKYEVSVGTVKSWASRYWKVEKSKKVAQPKNKKVAKVADKKVAGKKNKKTTTMKNSAAKKSAQPLHGKINTVEKYASLKGNQNAAGNRGGKGGPIRNKHAVKTHEFETIFWTADIIDDEEKSLLNADYDKYLLQYLLIDTLNIREKRILQDIKKLKATDGGMVFDSVTKNKSTTTTQYNKRDDKGELVPGSSNTVTEDNSSHVAHPVLKRIMELEEALTRIQSKKQRAIEVLHKMEMEDEKLAIDQMKFTLYKQRITGQIDLDELIDEDNFDDELGLHDE